MSTQEYNLETILISALETNVALTQQIVHKNEDDAAQKDRIIVQVENKIPSIICRKPEEKPKAWEAIAKISIRQATRNVAQMETFKAAIDSVMQSNTPDASVTTLALTYFPTGGLTSDQSAEGWTNGEDVEIRESGRAYLCRWPAQSNE